MGHVATIYRGLYAHKVSGGKLLYANVRHDGQRLIDVQITGDFFIHPESGIDALEKACLGHVISEGADTLASSLQAAIDGNRLELVGISASAVAATVMESARLANCEEKK